MLHHACNKLVAAATFERTNPDGERETIPARPITAADMQGAKSTYGMRECSHSVWCKCQRGEGGPQHRYPTEPVSTYAEVCTYITEVVGCELKTYEEMCGWAHYDPGVAKGGSFIGFKCSCCGYAPTEAKWRADLKAYHAMSDEEQAAAQSEHMDSNDPLNSNCKHYHQVKFMPPLAHHGMERCGVDNLHLTHLNFFKHLFRYTIHQGLPPSKKKFVRDYCKAAGFYSYDAASEDEDPTKHWIGREVKRFIEEGRIHIPFLLQIAAAPADCCTETAEFTNDNGELELDDDDEFDPTPQQIAAEEKEEPLMMRNAQRWDNFYAMVDALSKPWPQGDADTNEYREGRAVEAFNTDDGRLQQ